MVQDPDTYTEEEYRGLLKAAKAAGDVLIHDLSVVLGGTGMRFGEAAHLVPEALCWSPTPYIDIRARNGWTPKDPTEVKQIPMTDDVCAVLQDRGANANGGYLFANSCGNPIANNKTRERLQKLFPAAGIDTEGRRLHLHSFRNHFIRKCVDAGIPVDYIMLWTGHDSATMVLRYLRCKRMDTLGLGEFAKLGENREM